MVPIESNEEKEMINTDQNEVYQNAYQSAVNYVYNISPNKTYNEIAANLYHYIFSSDTYIIEESDYQAWLLGSLAGYDHALITIDFYNSEA